MRLNVTTLPTCLLPTIISREKGFGNSSARELCNIRNFMRENWFLHTEDTTCDLQVDWERRHCERNAKQKGRKKIVKIRRERMPISFLKGDALSLFSGDAKKQHRDNRKTFIECARKVAPIPLQPCLWSLRTLTTYLCCVRPFCCFELRKESTILVLTMSMVTLVVY